VKNIKNDEKLNVLNHSCAHLLAHAVKRLYPEAKLWVGPVVSEGFYYDIDLQDKVIKEEELISISREMKKIAKSDKLIKRIELTKEEALEKFKDNKMKIELINKMSNDEVISIYLQDEFMDLCRGPHVEKTKLLKNFKLLKVAGAYYKGDSKNKMLQRIYGVCFETEEELNEHLNLLEEAKKRDHRKLGKELELFMMNEHGPGFPFWLPNGMILRNLIEDFWYEEHTKDNYQFISTPIMLDDTLWKTSGHLDNYKDNMYFSEIDERTFAIKPMNCPGGMLVYKNKLHSYKEFPLKLGELGLVHRHEASGALSGLFRVRSFTQDDAHIFMTEDMIKDEIISLIKLIDRMYLVFGLEYRLELSTRPEEKFVGDIKIWDKAEKILEEVCVESGKEFKLNPGDGAFYGPKLDFHITDSLNRDWQCGTIQLDMQLPERFDLTYIDKDGSKKRPVMLHRVVLGSVERFIGILIEHFNGAFPLWLSPVQVNIIPVNNGYHYKYANEIKDVLLNKGIRINFDDRDEKLGYKIREAQMKKTPYTIIIGDKELESKTVSYRKFGEEGTSTETLEKFIENLLVEIKNKKISD